MYTRLTAKRFVKRWMVSPLHLLLLLVTQCRHAFILRLLELLFIRIVTLAHLPHLHDVLLRLLVHLLALLLLLFEVLFIVFFLFLFFFSSVVQLFSVDSKAIERLQAWHLAQDQVHLFFLSESEE